MEIFKPILPGVDKEKALNDWTHGIIWGRVFRKSEISQKDVINIRSYGGESGCWPLRSGEGVDGGESFGRVEGAGGRNASA